MALASALQDKVQEETNSAPPRKFRVQLDFAPKDYDEINNLVEEMELGTRAELFRSALIALRWMYMKKKAGCTVVAITPENRYLEPEFGFLQGVPGPK
jgi:hypothetical protein